MQISKQTPTVLELQTESGTYGWIKAFLLAMLFLVGITMFLPMMLDLFLDIKTRTVACSRVEPAQVNCRLTSSRLIGKWTRDINQVTGTEIDVRSSGNRGFKSHHLILLTGEKKEVPTGIRVTVSSRRDGQSRANAFREKVEQIDTFLSNPAELSVEIEHGNVAYRPLSVFSVIGILIPGAFLALVLKLPLPRRVILDKQKDWFCVDYDNALSWSNRVEGKLSDIEKARRYGSVQLVMKSGKRLNIAASKSHAGISNADLVTKINQFLHDSIA